jgi:hypothetical protein
METVGWNNGEMYINDAYDVVKGRHNETDVDIVLDYCV